MQIRRLAAVLAALTVVACTEDVPPPVTDATAPSVTSIAPADGAADVALDAALQATFDEAIDPASLAMALTRSDGTAVEGTVTVAEDALSATLQPAASLAEKAQYTLTISGHRDAVGNVGADASASFTTVAVPPTVVSSIPEKDAVQVALDTRILVELSEPVNADTAAAALKLTTSAGDVAASVAVDGNKVELKPADALAENTQYNIEIAGTLTDLAGVAIAAPLTISFTTLGDAPNVVSTLPLDAAQDVAVDSPVKFVFDKPLDAATVNPATVTLSQGGTAVDADVAYDSGALTVTLTPKDDLTEGASYEARATQALTGQNGLTLPADKVIGFKVASAPPAVVAIAPADQAQNVALGVNVEATFSEPIDAATLTDQTFFLKDGANTLAATLTFDAPTRKATLTPTSPLAEGRSYTATLTSGVKDRAGNAMAAAKSWSFTTLTTVPQVTGIVPADQATGVSGNAAISVTFSEAMDSSTFTASTFVVRRNATDVPGTRTWDDATRTATFQPTGAYAGASTITVRLTTGVKDRSGIALAQEFNSSFTVSNAPSVSASSPSPNATGVALSPAIGLTFSGAMDQSTLTGTNVYLEDAAGTKVGANYSSTATSITMTPVAALDESALYTVVVTTGVKSSSGVPFAAEYRYSFTTVGVPPTVTAIDPQNGATDVPVSKKLKITFNEDMDQATFTSANLRLSDGANDVAATVTALDARNVELDPDGALRERSTFTLHAGTGLKDLAGNGLAIEKVSTFTTEALPRVLYFAPAPGETGVATNATLLFAVNKPLTGTIKVSPKAGGSVEALTLYEDGLRIDGSAAWDSATLTVAVKKMENGAPATWAPGKRYTLELDGAKLADINGNPFAGRPSTSFVVGAGGDTSGPTLAGTLPQDGDTGVDRAAHPSATFSEQVDPSTLNATTVKLLDGATALAGRIEYQQSTRSVRFIPAQPLPANKPLTFQIGNGVKDLAGNGKAAVNSIQFTTQPNSAPAVVRIWPADGSADVTINSDIRIDFSEPIDPATLNVTVSSGALSQVTGTVAYDAQSKSAVFRPGADLPANRTISVTVESGLADAEGLATAQDIDAGSFATVANSAKDVTAPSVSATTPGEAATNVAANAAITFRFSEAVDPTTLTPANFTFEDGAGLKVAYAMSVETGGNSVTLQPSRPLTAGTTYTVAALAGITDLAGNALDENAASSVLTFSVDGTRPNVSRTSPVAGSTVGNSVRVELVFSEEIDPSTIDAGSVALSFGGNRLPASVSYDAASRTAILQPAGKLADGQQTVTLDATRIADLAGNRLNPSQGNAWTYTFGVSSSGPSVTAVDPCNSLVDAYDFATRSITFTFDRGVKKSGGTNLDGQALKLRLNGSDVAATVTHTAGQSSATLKTASPLEQGKQYEVVATSMVADNDTGAAMASEYTCTFGTQRVLFSDLVDDLSSTGYTVGAAQGGNRWARVNSTMDGTHNSIVWKGGNTADGQNYVRDAALLGAAADYTIVVERQIDLTGMTEAELRLDAFYDINGAAGDFGRVVAISGATSKELFGRFTGTTSAYSARMGKDSGNLTSMVGSTVTIRFELFINGFQGTGAGPAGGKGLFVDNLYVVGK